MLVDQEGHCVEWFGFGLSKVDNLVFGTETKETIIYELEMAAAVLVPTEANLSDYPSRLCPHPLLKVEQDKSDGASDAKISFEALKAYVAGYGGAHEVNGGGATRDHPRSKKRALVDNTLQSL